MNLFFAGFFNMNKIKVSHECTELIEELKNDILEFGGDMIVEAVVRDYSGAEVYVDYNLIDNHPATDLALMPNERTIKMTASALLVVFEEQNQVL